MWYGVPTWAGELRDRRGDRIGVREPAHLRLATRLQREPELGLELGVHALEVRRGSRPERTRAGTLGVVGRRGSGRRTRGHLRVPGQDPERVEVGHEQTLGAGGGAGAEHVAVHVHGEAAGGEVGPGEPVPAIRSKCAAGTTFPMTRPGTAVYCRYTCLTPCSRIAAATSWSAVSRPLSPSASPSALTLMPLLSTQAWARFHAARDCGRPYFTFLGRRYKRRHEDQRGGRNAPRGPGRGGVADGGAGRSARIRRAVGRRGVGLGRVRLATALGVATERIPITAGPGPCTSGTRRRSRGRRRRRWSAGRWAWRLARRWRVVEVR